MAGASLNITSRFFLFNSFQFINTKNDFLKL